MCQPIREGWDHQCYDMAVTLYCTHGCVTGAVYGARIPAPRRHAHQLKFCIITTLRQHLRKSTHCDPVRCNVVSCLFTLLCMFAFPGPSCVPSNWWWHQPNWATLVLALLCDSCSSHIAVATIPSVVVNCVQRIHWNEITGIRQSRDAKTCAPWTSKICLTKSSIVIILSSRKYGAVQTSGPMFKFNFIGVTSTNSVVACDKSSTAFSRGG